MAVDAYARRSKVSITRLHRTTTEASKLPNCASTFKVELYAITLAMVFIYCSKETNFVFFDFIFNLKGTLSGSDFKWILCKTNSSRTAVHAAAKSAVSLLIANVIQHVKSHFLSCV